MNSSDFGPKPRNAFGSILAGLEDKDSRRDSDLLFSLSLLSEHLCLEAIHERISKIPVQTLTLPLTALEFYL